MRRLEESYTTSPAVAHAGLWADVIKAGRGAGKRAPPVSGSGEGGRGAGKRDPHGSDSGRAVHGGSGPRTGEERRTSRRPRDSRTDGPNLAKGRSDGGGSSWPVRAGTAQTGPAAMARDGAARMRQRRKTAAGGDRPAAESGGVAAKRQLRG
uniref:Uncharacterized protein n=1 Tax=Oryza sativa subsp. japonica TaxID=39947 RepID=Q6K365_ORYSJ|nr:hypothetical protein [Oryza sativa Japonica Group]